MLDKDKTSAGERRRVRTCGYLPRKEPRGLTFVCSADGGIHFERYGRSMHLVANEPVRTWAPDTSVSAGSAALPVLLVTDSTEALGAMTQLLSEEGLEVAGSDDPTLAVSIMRNSGMTFHTVILCLEDSASDEEHAEALLNIVEQGNSPVVMMVRPGSGACAIARRRVPTANVIVMPASEADVVATVMRAQGRAQRRVSNRKA